MTPILLTLFVAATLQAPLPELILESRTAAALGLATGDSVFVSNLGGEETAFVVAGIYRRPADPSTVTLRDYRAILHIGDLQEILAAGDRVDRFSVLLRPDADREAVQITIDRLAFGAKSHKTEDVANATSQTFRVVARFHRALAGITITGSSVFLLCLVILKIEERRLEGAVMREVGISRRTLFLWMFSETIAMALIGTSIGLAVGWAGSGIINSYFGALYDTSLVFARVTPALALIVSAIGLGTGVVIGFFTGWQMVRASPLRLREP